MYLSLSLIAAESSPISEKIRELLNELLFLKVKNLNIRVYDSPNKYNNQYYDSFKLPFTLLNHEEIVNKLFINHLMK